MSGELTVEDLEVVADEPRVPDVRLGERLGMAQPLNIRATIEANRTELERYGSIHAARESIQSGKATIREVTVYRLNEAQALLLCMFSRTERAADIREEVIKTFLAYKKRADGEWSVVMKPCDFVMVERKNLSLNKRVMELQDTISDLSARLIVAQERIIQLIEASSSS